MLSIWVMLYIEVRKTFPPDVFVIPLSCTPFVNVSCCNRATCNIHSGRGVLSNTTRESNIYAFAVGNELSPCGRYCVLLLMRTPGDGGCRNECYLREPRGVCVVVVLQRRPFPMQVTLERSNTCSIKLIEISVA